MSANRPDRRLAFLILCFFVFLSYALTCHAESSSEPNRAPSFAAGLGGSGGGGGVGGSGTALPNLFTGTMSYSVPIEVAPGRKGMQPNLALSYSSNSGNGWVGVGWDLEVGAIERSTRNGIAYNDSDGYVLRLNGAAIDLVYDSSNDGFYRAKVEGAFFKVVRNSSYWDVYDKSGTHYTFGSTDDSKQYYPSDSSKVFKWCLNRVEDTNGNYMTYTYSKDQGQVYLDRIDYTGNSATGAGMTNYVKFYLEDRIDAPEMYGTNFKVVTAKRLKTIYVSGNGDPVRAYSLLYVPYSANTGRSLLAGVQQLGKDVQFSSGAVTGGSALPPVTFEWYNDSSAFIGKHWTSPGYWDIKDQNTAVLTGDFNGDGKTDIAWRRGGWTGWQVNISTSTGFSGGEWTSPGGWDVMDQNTAVLTGDFNGDGKTDIAWRRSTWAGWRVNISTGTGFTDGGEWTSPGGWDVMDQNTAVLTGDFNGDGKTDIAWRRGGWTGWQVNISTGSGFSGGEWTSPGGWDVMDQNTAVVTGDFNGDGKTDIAWRRSLQPGWKVNISRGDRFTGGEWTDTANWDYMDQNTAVVTGDFDGDGKTEIAWRRSAWATWEASKSTGAASDLLSQIFNGLGGSTSITYLPSTQYTNTLLPFPVQTVSSVRTFDGNATTSTTSYAYSGGFFHTGARDVRGFNYVKVTGPAGQLITETWYHQGNDTAVGANDPYGQDGYMKGKPYKTQIRDAQNNKIYLTTTTTYELKVSSPYYFAPTQQVDTYTCDAGAETCDSSAYGRWVKNVYTYDDYGNVTREDLYGGASDHSTDRTTTRGFAYNTSKWIVGIPTNETVYQGIGATTQKSKTDYYYDGSYACSSSSSGQSPAKGNLMLVCRWFDGGTSPATNMTYDSYGNLSSIQDPNGNTTSFGYDSTFTFLKTSTSPPTAILLDGLTTTTKYYGIDVPADVNATGLYGQVRSVTDPNTQETIMEYDFFGRKTYTLFPDGASTNWYYNDFGTVGTQNVQVSTSAGVNTWTYFDGFGRTTKQERTGPGGVKVAATTKYNSTGTVAETSIPYFINSAPNPLPKYIYEYDSLGRTTKVTNPDFTTASVCYNNGVATALDPDNHLKKDTRDALGRLVQVDEYTGTYQSCEDTATPYASTTYQYDVMGNLLFVTDANNNLTEMQYDTLGRKTYMKDPDMGEWTYQYYANGNLYKQTDAKGRTITFQYDALNRVTLKDYPAGTDMEYKYDESGHTNALGRLTTMTDASGATAYNYSNMGRPTTTQKSVDGTTYTTVIGYEQGRMASITYPLAPGETTPETVSYIYGAGSELTAIRNNATNYAYAVYQDYNALGQPGSVTNGNGVSTTYGYHDQNNRLTGITTTSQAQQLLNLTYEYWPGGNIKSITDPNMPSVSSPGMEVTYSHHPTVRPHAVTATTDGYSFQYDDNGSMESDGLRAIAYDYDNMPKSITIGGDTTSFVYDGSGARVKKTGSNGTNIYIGKLYECNAVGCTKYIFAGGTRIAAKFGDGVLYYHQDHLGSTRVVTEDVVAADPPRLSYYPFGETQSMSGPFNVTHQYTSQEIDPETGLYYYNARYYNPSLGRFISADTIIPDPSNPQAFNRYAYVLNNPLIYTDPYGYSWHRRDWQAAGVVAATAAATWYCGGCGAGYAALVGETIGGYSASRAGGDVLTGVVAGGIAGAVGYGAGTWVAGATGSGLLAGGIGGAAGGAAGGGTAAAMSGGNIERGITTGAYYGAIAGSVSGGLASAGVPGAIAAAGGGYASGYTEGGSRAGQQGALYGFAGGALNSMITMFGLRGNQQNVSDIPKTVTPDGKPLPTGDVYAVTPKLTNPLTVLLALIGDGNSHVWHTSDTSLPVDGSRYATLLATGASYPSEVYWEPGPYNLFTNNCVTRFQNGFWSPSQWNASINYPGTGYYWGQ